MRGKKTTADKMPW